MLTPRNHGNASWVYLSSFGGGLVDGDALDIDVEVDPGASALLGTQASTKVYRARGAAGDPRGERPPGCSQALSARVGEGALLALLPDPVVCFAEARYAQSIAIALAPGASLVAMDGYTCGRSARGERWAFSRYASRTAITRGEGDGDASDGPRDLLVDATLLDPRHGPIAERMGRFDAVLSLVAFGPRLAAVREAMLAIAPQASAGALVVSASAIGGDREQRDHGCIVRVAAERFETASLALRSSFAVLAGVLGDDPFARKW